MHESKIPPSWEDLPIETRELLSGKLAGLWGGGNDEQVFNGLSMDKKFALLLILRRMHKKAIWNVVKRIRNVYGEGGVGIDFEAWPFIQSTLLRHSDFTKLFANHKDTSGGFYEKGRAEAVLHFLYQEGNPRRWYVHFDLYSPVHSLSSAVKHFRLEYLGKLKPDFRMIERVFKAGAREAQLGTRSNSHV